MKTLRLLLSLFLIAIMVPGPAAVAAIGAGAISEFQVEATNSMANGIFYNPNGAAIGTDLATDTNTGDISAPVVSSATYTFTSTNVGAKLHLRSGTNWQPNRWYTISSVTAGKATLAAAVGDADELNTALSGARGPVFAPSTIQGMGVGTGGAYVTLTGGTFAIDYSQQTSPAYSLTGLTTAGADAILLTASATLDMKSNGLHLDSGTNFTQSWYEVTAVTAGVSITLDRNVATAAGAAGTAKVGGAGDFGGSLEDDYFELVSASAWTFFKKATDASLYYDYLATENISTGANPGSNSTTMHWQGYRTRRGDLGISSPSTYYSGSGTRWYFNYPHINFNASLTLLTAPYLSMHNIAMSGANSQVVATGGSTYNTSCMVMNYSDTIGRQGLVTSSSSNGGDSTFTGWDAVSPSGNAIYSSLATVTSARIRGCYFHHSRSGMYLTSGRASVTSNLFFGNWDDGIGINTATAPQEIYGNLIIGQLTPTKNTAVSPAMGGADGTVGIATGATTTMIDALNNIIVGYKYPFYGFTGTSSQQKNISDFTLMYNCTTTPTRWTLSPTDTAAINPNISGVYEMLGTAGSITTGSLVFTDSSANFTAVQADGTYLRGGGVDVWYNYTSSKGYFIKSVDSATQLTMMGNAEWPGGPTSLGTTSSSISWGIVLGRNIKIGTGAVRTFAFPSVFNGTDTQNSATPGAVQPQRATAY